MTNQSASPNNASWEKFCALRLQYLIDLAEVVERAFVRQDTTHPAFCGCIDWHSSVHGAYALLTVGRLTGQSRWAEIVDAALSSECLEAELASLRNGALNHEMPYGFSWFLKLAIEREQGWGKRDLLPLAGEIVTKLEEWIFSLRAGEVITHLKQRDYGNLSWTLLNVWHWSQWQADQELMEKLREFTRMWVVLLDERLPPSYDHVTDEFFAASLQRTRTILTILPREESLQWYESFYPKDFSMEPIHTASTPHSAGLNFSRAWAFWTLFQSTQDLAFRDMYVHHILTHMNLPECWRDGYRKHAHWVPQFGIYAIALSMEG
jgi:hypothetical protein